jgi:hypothetical protein
MAISQTQIVDYLLKKIGYGVAKTDVSTAKSPSNEANASPLLSPGVTIWQQDFLIPSVTVLPTSNSAVVTIYSDTLNTSVQTVNLAESTTNQTWATNLTNWIPTQYGSGYQLKLYAAPSGNSAPQTYGVSLPQAGSGNNDSWFFDYQSGLINFADTNVPSAVTWNGSTGNVVYAVGARYTGQTGISNFLSPITFSNTVVFNANITATNVAANGSAVFSGNITANTNIVAANGSITANTNITTNNGNVNVPNGNVTASFLVGKLVGNLFSSNIQSSGTDANISITPGNNGVVNFYSNTAIKVPVGSTSQYPPVPTVGMIRWNTTYGYLEIFTGSIWEAVGLEGAGSTATSDTFTPDGTGKVFTLSQNNTTQGTIVSINGVVQIPTTSYTVNGNVLTLSEVPLVTDVVEARSIVASAQVGILINGNTSTRVLQTGNNGYISMVNFGRQTANIDNTNLNLYTNLVTANAVICNNAAQSVGTDTIVIDSFDPGAYRTAKYLVSVSNSNRGEYQSMEALVIHNGTYANITSFAVQTTGSTLLTLSSNIYSGSVSLWATSSYTGNSIRVAPTYMAT